MSVLFQPFRLGDLDLPSRIVMAPLTRRRAGLGKVPTELNALHYAQRAGAALIISESTEVDPLSSGATPTRPGLFDQAQEDGWRLVTDAVHKAGGRIFAQLSHMGRTAHTNQRVDEALPIAPSAIQAKGSVFTPAGQLPYVLPRELATEEVAGSVAEFAAAAARAKSAGFAWNCTPPMVTSSTSSCATPATSAPTVTAARSTTAPGSCSKRWKRRSSTGRPAASA